MNLNTALIVSKLHLENQLQEILINNFLVFPEEAELYQGQEIDTEKITIALVRRRETNEVEYDSETEIPLINDDGTYPNLKAYSEKYLNQFAKDNNCFLRLYSAINSNIALATLISVNNQGNEKSFERSNSVDLIKTEVMNPEIETESNPETISEPAKIETDNESDNGSENHTDIFGTENP